MSILSDHEIKKLCTIPPNATYFDEELYQQLIRERVSWPLTDHACELIRSELRQRATREYTLAERSNFRPMIEPYCEAQVRGVMNTVTKPIGGSFETGLHMVEVPTNLRKVLSFGQSSYGYDVRLSEEIRIFSNIASAIVDPKNFDERCLVKAAIRTDDSGSYVVLPPNSYLLGHTMEYFRMPRDVTAVFLAKSTYARVGVSINATPAEAGWEGVLVLEVANLTTLPVKIYTGEGIAQALFFKGNMPCATSYADRGGKYQHQEGIQLAKV